MQQIAAKAVCLKEAATPAFKEYAKQIVLNAKAMEEVFRAEGVRMIAGGTDNHLLLLDTQSSFGISGGEAEKLLGEAGITANKNVIPNDERKAFDPSGLRLGTPAITTRGLKEEDAAQVARIIVSIFKDKEGVSKREEVRKLALAHPIPDSFA